MLNKKSLTWQQKFGDCHISDILFKGSEQLCMVFELSMQYCNFFRIHLIILRCIFTEFDCKVDFQNHLFGWIAGHSL